jgi:hypothetical protein
MKRWILGFVVLVVVVVPSRHSAADDLFESDSYSNNIYEFTPGGTRSTFASGFEPTGLAFDSSGNLFVANYNNTATNGTVGPLVPAVSAQSGL